MEWYNPRNFDITGDISIKPVMGRIPNLPDPCLYLIMGPTGAGKSAFIEAFAGESQQLSISNEQLVGYTQTVNAYQVVNVNFFDEPVYLVDTPGFSDSKISEVEIVDMVRKWLKDNLLESVDAILYLTPISDTRLPGSRRRTMEMLKQLLEPNGGQRSVTFVTTMWDTLRNERTLTRAESNFAQLTDGICKDFFGDLYVSITRFMNTRKSAFEVLDSAYHYSRIEGALQEKQMIELELAQPEAQIDTNLSAMLEKNQRENHETLTKFIRQFVNFGPLPAEFRLAAQHLRKSIAANTTPLNLKYKWLCWQWEHEAEITADGDLNTSTGVLVIKGLARSLFKLPKRRGVESSERDE
ncbi:P-loop containing nucleoside triphosphate hydrolase protein [Panaeolus papilionaceus]|nr:P-loop containing nucleoside triphosphate hydrolase protein [Panaeolus papilionaceus]